MKKIIIFSLFLCFCTFPIIVLAESNSSTPDYVYEQLAECVLNFKDEIVIHTDNNIKSINLEKINTEVQKKNQVLGGNITSITYEYKEDILKANFTYLMNKFEYKRSLKMAEKISKQIEGLTDYQKIKATHDYLTEIYTYSYMHQGPYDGLYKGLTNCTGYAMSFQMIMDYCNIPCKYVDNDTHAWNLVKVENKWYNIDLTWDDEETSEPSYKYFLKGNSVFATSHGANDLCEYDSFNADLNFKYPIKNETNRNKIIVTILVGAIVFTILFEKIKHKKHLKEKGNSSSYNSQKRLNKLTIVNGEKINLERSNK